MRNNEDRLGAKQETQDATPPQVVQQNSLNLNFITPTEYVDLPSKGKFYPVNHPLHNQDVLEIKQMTAKEEDILTSRNLLKKGVALDKLLESLIVDKSINPQSLTVEDRNAIIIKARISGYGQNYDTTVVCPSCGKKVKQKFDLLEKLNEFQNEENVEEVQVRDDGMFEVNLPATKWKIVCRALNGSDEKFVLKMNEEKKKSQDDSVLIDQLVMTVVSIQDISDKVTIKKALESMPASDSRYLRKKYQSVVKGIDMTKSFVCPSCDFEGEMEVLISADFFWFK